LSPAHSLLKNDDWQTTAKVARHIEAALCMRGL
jgi:hypothetical protein